MNDNGFDIRASKIAKVDESLGLVIGWALVSKIDGKPHFDTQGDHIPEAAMLEATLDFMAEARIAKEMHKGDQIGDIVFGFPMTSDIAKALGIETPINGFLIGFKPSSDDVLEKFRDGTYTGFSIGGKVLESHDG